ncbi:hypothetical protein [Pseudomonas oryziphila]|uniref:hypothetical protein n=1 Tax=Pseudomonas oryziphila TaxID=2894079 RepID=UPI001681204C|nr:hypothetical protein [Pseudomonas oryziphila]
MRAAPLRGGGSSATGLVATAGAQAGEWCGPHHFEVVAATPLGLADSVGDA